MDEEPTVNALTPREIQQRIRSGSSVAEVVDETGMDQSRVEAFAGPVLAERQHMAQASQTATVRRRGESGTHRRLGDLLAARLRPRGIDTDTIAWDAWRQPDLKWRVVARVGEGAESREGEFVFDPKARFSVAHNADARWMIGEESPADATTDDENTIDFTDEMALVRAVTRPDPSMPGDDVPASELMHGGNEDTSQLDRLYDMLSGISEDSVRIYTGILDPAAAGSESPDEELDEASLGGGIPPEPEGEEPAVEDAGKDPVQPVTMAEDEHTSEVPEPSQEPLVESADDAPKKPRARRRRAKVPTWDEIMFGGPSD